jgi:enoyl-CoA hydratase/carnithine racemase
MAVVEWERRGATALVTLNRPERPAISPEVSETMVGILDEIELRPGTAVVLTGAGEVFSAGADLKVSRRVGRSTSPSKATSPAS